MGEKLTLYEDKIDEKELAQLSSGIYNYFVDNDLYVEDIWTQDGQICYGINRGDWKHEHGRSTYLANNFLFDKGYYISSLEQEVTEDDGSDTYSAIHKITVEPILKESLNENYVVVGIDKEQNRKFYDEDSNEWTEDENKATIYQTTEEVRDKWNDIDKENFEKVFCPLYDKREEE